MGHAPASWIKMKSLFFINCFTVAIIFGQVPIQKLPPFPPVELPDLNVSDSNKTVSGPPQRSSQVETIRKAEIDLRDNISNRLNAEIEDLREEMLMAK